MKKIIYTILSLCIFSSLSLITISCTNKQIREEIGPSTYSGHSEQYDEGDTKEKNYQEGDVEEESDAANRPRTWADSYTELSDAERLRQDIQEFEDENIYFAYDMYELTPEAKSILMKKAEWLAGNPGYSVQIEGHCDERGTNEYNLALGEKRADVAYAFLVNLGISGNRITTMSYGEEMPAASGKNEAAWKQNRRDEFKLYK